MVDNFHSAVQRWKYFVIILQNFKHNDGTESPFIYIEQKWKRYTYILAQ